MAVSVAMPTIANDSNSKVARIAADPWAVTGCAAIGLAVAVPARFVWVDPFVKVGCVVSAFCAD